MEARPVLYLIDGHALAYRSYFALKYWRLHDLKRRKHQRRIWIHAHTCLMCTSITNPNTLRSHLIAGLSGREAALQ